MKAHLLSWENDSAKVRKSLTFVTFEEPMQATEIEQLAAVVAAEMTTPEPASHREGF